MTEHWHGTVNGYSNRKCRCQPCRDAWTAYITERRAKRTAAMKAGDIDREHGKYTTYTNYGCRCPECKDANRLYAQGKRFGAKTSGE